jgi:hypothetical protein
MIGQRIESQSSTPIGAVLVVILAVGLDAAAAVAYNPHPAILSIVLWCIAVLLFASREPPFVAVLTEKGIEVESPNQTIPYTDFQGLRAPGRPSNPFKRAPSSFRLVLIHAGGVLRIPRRLNVSSDDLFLFLLKQFPTEAARAIDERLEAFRARKEAEFGAERIWCYVARGVLGNEHDSRALVAIAVGVLLAGIAWIFTAVIRHEEGWGVAGGLAVFFGGLTALIAWLQPRQAPLQIKKWREASIVICPDSLGLVQGDLRGQLQWRELRSVKFTSAWVGEFLLLKVAGAQILIADLYNRPLTLLYQHIHYYWRGEGATAAKPTWAESEPLRATVEPIRPGSTGITPGYLTGRSLFPE